MAGHCNRDSGRCHKAGRQFPLYLGEDSVVISPIDRADVTPHAIALVKVFEQYHSWKNYCIKFGMAEARCARGGDPWVQTILYLPACSRRKRESNGVE
jgi:hypothetical protein